MRKAWIGVDLDGTLAEHYWPDQGGYDPYRIGEPLAPMIERVKQWVANGTDVRIFTARVGPNGSYPGADETENVERIKEAIRAWTKEHIGVPLEATCTKDYAMIALYDDRAVQVEHNTGRLVA